MINMNEYKRKKFIKECKENFHAFHNYMDIARETKSEQAWNKAYNEIDIVWSWIESLVKEEREKAIKEIKRLRDIKLNTQKRKELFCKDMLKLLKSLKLEDEYELKVCIEFTVFLEQKLKVGLFKQVKE